MSEDYDWPCDKRTAHGPHHEQVEVTRLADPEPKYVDGRPCPGVKAHPDTMIGRQ